jgi:cytochrome c5
MKKLALIILAGASAAILSLSALPQEAGAGKACSRTEGYKTKMVKEACQKGQDAAKKAMREFVKEAKKVAKTNVTCNTCHEKTSGDYPLKKDGLKKFKEWGGK